MSILLKNGQGRRGRALLVAGLLCWPCAAAWAAAPAVAEPAVSTPAAVADPAALMSARATSAVLLSIKKSGDRIIAVGERGTVLYSRDRGGRWRQGQVPTSVTLTNVSFSPAGVAWAVGHGGMILRSADAGARWGKLLDGARAAEIEYAAARAGGDPERLAGAERLRADGPDKPFFDLYFWDEDHGLVVGAYGLIFATADGGRNWRSLMDVSANPDGKHLYAIERVGDDLYIAGEQGLLLKSADFGRSFKKLDSPYQGTWFGALGLGKSGAMVLYGLRGHAYISGGGGQAWRQLDLGKDLTVTAALAMADGAIVLGDETGRVLRSTDGGAHFEALPLADASYVAGMVEAGPGNLVLVGPRGVRQVALSGKQTEKK